MPPPPLPPLSPLWTPRIFGGTQQSNRKDVDDPRIPTTDHLVFTGYTVLQLGIVTWLNHRYPKYPYGSLTAKLTTMMERKPASWSKLYKLPSRLPVSKVQKQPENTLLSRGNLFAAYVGAIYSDSGNKVVTINNFIMAILDFEEKEGIAESESGDETIPMAQAYVKTFPEGMSARRVASHGSSHGSFVDPIHNGKPSTTVSLPSSPVESSQNPLSYFNELSAKRKVEASWDAESSGPDHIKVWVATLTVGDKQFHGQGNGKSQAKAAAAEMALKALKWI
ncbi:hypothetical protein BU17DRAFT_66071 [Hysterangium stoloniferum]|nr:hypothetical protein BU17DRAFT_66071 [Hysterangium stoloniferum]